MSSKKKEDAASENGNCCAKNGQKGGSRCKTTEYCGKGCQHEDRKQFCVPSEERVQAPPSQAAAAPSVHYLPDEDDASPEECPVCLEMITSGTTCKLPCMHTFHVACVEKLRSFGIKQTCPMCRAFLPPEPSQLVDDAARLYYTVAERVERGETSWAELTKGGQPDMAEAIKLLRGAAEQGHPQAQYNLGLFFATGEGVPRDAAEAARWTRRAAEQGDANAQFDHSNNCYHGRGVATDHAAAFRWRRASAEQGHRLAQYEVGVQYNMGEGVKQSFAEAARWFRRAAEQGVADGQFNIGVMHYYGRGVKKDHAAALRWWGEAAEQGYARASNALGCMFVGGEGVAQDFAAAARWFRKAAEQGVPGAEERAVRAEEHAIAAV